jgi:broad specificity phosphatase PhoE
MNLSVRIDWLCHAPTRAMREAAFPTIDERPDEAGLRKAQALAGAFDRYDTVVSSPAAAARDTARAIGVDFTDQPLIRDIDHGRWSGKSMIELHATDPDRLAAWMADTSQATPDGEPLADVVARAGEWMDAQVRTSGRILAITHPTVIRAALSIVLQCPVESVFNIDIVPLTRTTISFSGKWRLQALNAALSTR